MVAKERLEPAVLSLVVVVILALLGRSSDSAVFFYLLPGGWVSLLITGGHGGSESAERIAFMARFLANVAVYYAVFALLLGIRRRHKHP